MNLSSLKKFAQSARRTLMAQVDAQLEYVLSHDDAYLRAHEAQKRTIQKRLQEIDRNQLVEETAYTWFNRIAALRFMDVNGYNPVRIVSPQGGQRQPEVLFSIKQGRVPKQLSRYEETCNDYLSGRIETDQRERPDYRQQPSWPLNRAGIESRHAESVRYNHTRCLNPAVRRSV